MRVIVRTVSELCITVGTLIVLFVVYVLFWTGVKADTEMDHQVDLLQDQWAKQPVRPTSGPGASAAPEPPAPYEDGKPFALMYIPRLGSTWNKPVLEGTKTDTLQKGLGHYANTAQLGQKGNFAVMRPPPYVRRPLQRFSQAAPRRRGRPERRGGLVHVRHRQGPLSDIAHGRPGHRPRADEVGVHARGALSDVDDVRPGVGTQPSAHRLGPSGIHAACGVRETGGTAPLVW